MLSCFIEKRVNCALCPPDIKMRYFENAKYYQSRGATYKLMYLILTISDGAFSVEGNIHDAKLISMFIFYSEVKLNILMKIAKMPF